MSTLSRKAPTTSYGLDAISYINERGECCSPDGNYKLVTAVPKEELKAYRDQIVQFHLFFTDRCNQIFGRQLGEPFVEVYALDKDPFTGTYIIFVDMYGVARGIPKSVTEDQIQELKEHAKKLSSGYYIWTI
jgi:hypothetical protein